MALLAGTSMDLDMRDINLLSKCSVYIICRSMNRWIVLQ